MTDSPKREDPMTFYEICKGIEERDFLPIMIHINWENDSDLEVSIVGKNFENVALEYTANKGALC